MSSILSWQMQNEMQVFSLFMQWKCMHDEQVNEHWFFFAWLVAQRFVFQKTRFFIVYMHAIMRWYTCMHDDMLNAWFDYLSWMQCIDMQVIMSWYRCMHDASYTRWHATWLHGVNHTMNAMHRYASDHELI
jgi:hypothetical protein